MDDLEFVRRCIKGDKAAWDKFVRQYSRLIYSYIYSVLKIKGSVVSEGNIHDLFQEIFLSLVQDNFKKLRSFKAKNGCRLASWLRQVAVNFSIDYLRKLKPSVVSIDEESDDGLSLKEMLCYDAVPVSDRLSENEKLGHLKECIDQLDKNDKYFLELHINRDLSLEELRHHFKISRGAIDMRKSRIIERLKECFKHQGFALDF